MTKNCPATPIAQNDELPHHEERRKVYAAVPYDRRNETNIQTRVAVLEVQQANHMESINAQKEFNIDVVRKLDSHMVTSTERDHEIQLSVGKIAIAVTNLSDTVSQTNESLKVIAIMATESRDSISKWDTIITVCAKIVTAASIIIGALWSVYTYIDTHHPLTVASDSSTSSP
jgi:hypothetical protein